MDKIIVYCGTRNIYNTMAVAAKSALCHNNIDKIYFFIEDDVFPEYLPSFVECINVSDQKWFPFNNSTWTYMANMRFVIGKILPGIDTALYLDTDTLVLGDISEVFNTDLTGKLFAMVAEDVNEITIEYLNGFKLLSSGISAIKSDNARPSYPIRPYYNSGVMYMNIREMTSSGMDESLIKEVTSSLYEYPDQDAINILCHEMIVPLPHEYNVMPAISPDFPTDRIRIKHYASDKPLWKSSLWQQYRRMSWDTVMERQESLHE